MSFWRLLRITALLTVLVIVAGSQWLTSSRISSWEKPLWMTIYPVVADADPATRPYVESLEPDSFNDIGAFLARQGGRYGNGFFLISELFFTGELASKERASRLQR